MSHALLKPLGIGTCLWSVARGLAREEHTYKNLLIQADGPREGGRDGRGNLTQRGLIEFSRFFLERAIGQTVFGAIALAGCGVAIAAATALGFG